MKLILTLPGLGLLAAFAALPSTARAAESFDNCRGFIDSLPATINTQGVWCLRKDLATAQATGESIRIWTNNVTIDCNGYKLGGLAAGAATQTTGIMTNSATNVTVRNCNIRGFQQGLQLYGTAEGYGGHLVEDNRFEGNTSEAINVGGDGTVVRRNLVLDTGGGSGGGSPSGINANGNIDIVDNIISGAMAGNDSTAAPSGIKAIGNTSGTISGNRIRRLVPLGTYFYGIILNGAGTPVVAGNHIVLHPAPAGNGYGVRCNSSSTALVRDNVISGFTFDISACIDAGGNYSPP